jgi:hypothetical protein
MSSTPRTDHAATATTGHATTHAVCRVPESSDPTVATTARTETEAKLWQALGANPNSTAAELSAEAGIGRSTGAKILARWANDGSVTRTPGITEDGRRAADLWSITDPDAASVTSELADTEHADENAATTPSHTRTPPTDTNETVADGDGPDEVTADAVPTTAGGEDTSEDGQQKLRRLPSGGLRGLVEDWLREHPSDEFSPARSAKHSGAPRVPWPMPWTGSSPTGTPGKPATSPNGSPPPTPSPSLLPPTKTPLHSRHSW